LWRVSAKFIPHVLAADKKKNPLLICTDLLRKAEPDGRDAAAVFTLEVKIISVAEKQLGAG